MKLLFAASVAVICAASASTPAPLEKDARYPDEWTAERAQAVADDLSQLIRLNRCRCDSVTSISLWTFRPGFSVWCNDLLYRFEVEDKGGRWTVTVK